MVLITAEIIAKVYYKALREATGSPLLQRLCDQILMDEDQHILFQSWTLGLFFSQKNGLKKFLTRGWHRILMTGTMVIVWIQHGRVLRAGGYSFSSFLVNTWQVFLECDKQVRGLQLRGAVYA